VGTQHYNLYACADRPLPPGRFLVLLSITGCVDPRAIVRLEGLGQLKNAMSGSDPQRAWRQDELTGGKPPVVK
jgi:hypothetical protein